MLIPAASVLVGFVSVGVPLLSSGAGHCGACLPAAGIAGDLSLSTSSRVVLVVEGVEHSVGVNHPLSREAASFNSSAMFPGASCDHGFAQPQRSATAWAESRAFVFREVFLCERANPAFPPQGSWWGYDEKLGENVSKAARDSRVQARIPKAVFFARTGRNPLPLLPGLHTVRSESFRTINLTGNA